MTTTHPDAPEVTGTTATAATAITASVLARLGRAWNAGDGAAFAAPYADDATFVTIRGEHHRGRPAIAGGHAAIFATIYAGSTNRMEVIDARFVTDDVIVAASRSTLDAPRGPLAGVHTATSSSILVRTAQTWQVALTHNTLEATR